MGDIWSEEHKYDTWLKVEIAACEAQAQLGFIPKEAVAKIKATARFDMSRILVIEEEVKHDVIAFLTNVAEYVGDEARFIHLGLTSSDLLDTALALQTRDAGQLLLEGLVKMRAVLRSQALAYKNTVCIGRSHGVHAEPTSFGLKFALWYNEMGRNFARMQHAVHSISLGKISGAVGTFAYIDPMVEKIVCDKLRLKPARIATQIVQRDVHAEFMTALALVGCSLEKIAVEIRHLQRTEVLEAEEPFSKGQKGSSAMPHKRNPIGCENVSGLARLLRTNALAAMENVALWHERDISHSSVERVIVPDSCILADYMLARLTKILENLVVYPKNMLANLRLTKGLIFSQPVLLALTQAGMNREDAYQIVQTHAMACWQERSDFKAAILADQRITALLTAKEIDNCFDETIGLRYVDYIYHRVGIE